MRIRLVPQQTTPPRARRYLARHHVAASGRQGASVASFTNSLGMQFNLVPEGSFMMGSPPEELGRRLREIQHNVTISRSYWLGTHQVTQAAYQQVIGANPSVFKGGKRPVENLTWHQAVDFCARLSKLPEEKAAGRAYRLPTEAEWEYACRAGSSDAFGFGHDGSRLGEYGWFSDNSDDGTHPVGTKRPNTWGFHDLHGNVFEWCQDLYVDYASATASAPGRLCGSSYRVARGGCWVVPAEFCRSAYRHASTQAYRCSFIGFRIALTWSGPTGQVVRSDSAVSYNPARQVSFH
jgi:formylglycine-generating enzyme required for sulfatase activity